MCRAKNAHNWFCGTKWLPNSMEQWIGCVMAWRHIEREITYIHQENDSFLLSGSSQAVKRQNMRAAVTARGARARLFVTERSRSFGVHVSTTVDEVAGGGEAWWWNDG
eukprot:scaffold119284_cov66-Attheya_sp.AAC.3